MSKENKIRVYKAFRAMKALGINEDKVKPVLKELLKLNNKNWELIEAENYRALVTALSERDAKEVEECPKKNVDDEMKDLVVDESEEPERPLKRMKDGQTSSCNMSKAHTSNIPHINVNIEKSRVFEKLNYLAVERRLAGETNLGSKLTSHPTTSEKRKVSDSTHLSWLGNNFGRDELTSFKPKSAKTYAPTSAKAKSLVEIAISDIPREGSGIEGGVYPLTSPMPVGSSSQVPLDSFLMSLSKELSGLDMPGIAAAGSEWQVGHALRQFASGAFSLICAQEGMKSRHATISKLQAEATALTLEVAEANRAKATAAENLVTSQGVVQSLLEEIEGMQATLGKTMAQLQARDQELEACKKELEAAKDLDSTNGLRWEAIKQVALEALVDTICESHPEWDLSFLYQET